MVCGKAGSVHEAMRAIETLEPDVVVLDLALPECQGLEVIKDIVSRHPDLPVLVFTMHEESVYAERVLRAGALGFLMKQETSCNLLTAIRTVLRGQYAISQAASSTLLHDLFNARTSTVKSGVCMLTDREFEVFELIGRGKGTPQIARELSRSVKTVETYRKRIKVKFQLKSGTELVRRAVSWVEGQRVAAPWEGECKNVPNGREDSDGRPEEPGRSERDGFTAATNGERPH